MAKRTTNVDQESRTPEISTLGLRLTGKVTARSKRTFINKETGEEKSVVLYQIATDSTIYKVEDWEGREPFAIGEVITEIVSIRVFKTRQGAPMFTLSFGESTLPGESF